MGEYSQGVCHDGAAILCNGVMLTVDEIVERLNRLATLEAEKAERGRQEPVAWACGHYLFKRKPHWATDSIPVGEEPQPLYALREPTEEECSRIYAIADRNPITRGPEIGEMPVRAGRAMWQAVREVMTK